MSVKDDFTEIRTGVEQYDGPWTHYAMKRVLAAYDRAIRQRDWAWEMFDSTQHLSDGFPYLPSADHWDAMREYS